MPRSLAGLFGLGLILMIAGSASAADEPQKILDDALQAHGGADALAKTHRMVREVQGKILKLGKEFPFTGDATLQFPERARWKFDLDAGGRKLPYILVVNGAQGWSSGGGMTNELTEQEQAELSEETYSTWISTLAPLKDKAFTLEALPEIKVDGKAARGLKVSHKGSPDIKLYFDKQSNLLVKLERKAKEAGQDALKEYVFSNHKEFEKVKLPTKCVETSNGKQTAEWTVSKYSFPAKLDDKLFGRP